MTTTSNKNKNNATLAHEVAFYVGVQRAGSRTQNWAKQEAAARKVLAARGVSSEVLELAVTLNLDAKLRGNAWDLFLAAEALAA